MALPLLHTRHSHENPRYESPASHLRRWRRWCAPRAELRAYGSEQSLCWPLAARRQHGYYEMRALVIAPEPFFTPRGTPLSVYYRTLLMAESGVSVDLLTYGQGHDVDLPGVRLIRTPALRWFGAVRVGPSALKAMHDVLLVLRAVALLLRNRYDFVHAHEESVFFARLLKPLFRFQLVYDMHSSLPQQLENFQFTSSRALIWLFERLERASLTGADAVITICPELARLAIDRMPDPSRHFLIENSLLDEVRLKSGAHTALETGEVEPPVPANRPLI